MKNRGIIYVRESTKDQDWESQLLECRKYCKRNNIKVLKEYVDLMSGARNDRKGFIELQDDIARGEFDILVVWELSRTTRDFVTHRLMIDSMNEMGIQLHSLQEGVLNDHEDIDKMFGIDIMALLNERERKVVGRRIKHRSRFITESGLWSGGRLPFGYDNTPEKILVPNDKAPIVREIFDLYIKGATLTELARKFSFNDDKNIHRMIRNPIYIGKLKLNESEVVNGKRVTYKKYKTVEGKHKAIIDKETFEIANALLSGKRKKSHSHNYILPAVYCHCGSRMYPGLIKGTIGYSCETCKGYIRGDNLEKQVFSILNKQLKKFEIINSIEHGKDSVEHKLKFYRSEVNKLKKQEEMLTNKYIQELISEELFDTKIKEIKGKMGEFQDEVEKYSKMTIPKQQVNNIEIFKKYLKKLEKEKDRRKMERILNLVISEIRMVNNYRCVIITNII